MPSRITTTAAAAILLALFATACPRVCANPPGSGDWRRVHELTDSFAGTRLNPKKWHDHDPLWHGRKPALFSPRNVSVKDGSLNLTARAETLPDAPAGYHSFTTAAVKSLATIRYGYFEVKARPTRTCLASSFWLYKSTPEAWTEIDGYEIGGGAPGQEKTYHTSAHVFHTPSVKRTKNNRLAFDKEWVAPVALADGFNVYGLEWDAKHIKWYFNGKLIRTLENKHWHYPLHLMFDCETMPGWFGLPKKENLPATYKIAYVRVWQRPEDGPSAAPEAPKDGLPGE